MKKGYENVAVQTFAYTYTRQAPVGLTPHDNVIIELCSIECCFAHALDDPDCPDNVKFMKDLDDRSKICNRQRNSLHESNETSLAGYTTRQMRKKTGSR